MGTELFIHRNFSVGSLAIIEKANEIIAEYQEQGFSLTLRQLYYQFVARDLIRNKQSEYKRLGSIINDARLAGMIDWESIEDRTRNVHTHPSWETPGDVIRDASAWYQEDLWDNQPYRPEVWIEKDALLGVIEGVCSQFRVPYFACRGNVSQSEQWRAGKRFEATYDRGQIPIVFHLGDHDPSGIDMTRDNQERLSMFAGQDVEVKRLALNMDQIKRYRPPPNPAKESDSRFAAYAAKYGDKSWELDALDPKVIDALIRRAIESVIEDDYWDEAKAREDARKDTLKVASRRWPDVEKFLSKKGGR